MSSPERFDVVIAGAGPGGSSAAILLAEAGHRVLVLEKEEFPRFHIGESLLPASALLVDVLGIDPDPNVFLFKRGAQFVCEKTGRNQTFDFAEALPGPQRYAWHVDRAKFDTMLRDRAREVGAEVRHGVRVSDVVFSEDEVRVATPDGDFRARYFIDATGQSRLLASKHRTILPYRHFGKAACFTHYEGLTEAGREALGAGNDIRIMVAPDGWVWVIPLAGNRLSVGLIGREKGFGQPHLEAFLADSPFLAKVTAGATRVETRLIGNFSFRNTQPSGARYTCVGDASCFLDPVFSSGVTLAIAGAKKMTDRLGPALTAGTEGDPALMAPVSAALTAGYDAFASMIYRFYNTRFLDNMIFGAPADGVYRPGIVSILAGDVFRSDNPFRDMLLASTRHPWREGDESALGEAREAEPVVL